MARLGWSLPKGPWCSGPLPRWTQAVSFSKLLAGLYLTGVQNGFGEVGEVKGPLYSEPAVTSLWLFGRL